MPSPCTSTTPLYSIDSGTHLMVLTCWVTSSPSTPLPLVAALSNLPSLYSKLIVNPSNLYSSEHFGIKPHALTSLSIQADKASFVWHLSREYSLPRCLTLLKPLSMTSPTRLVGELSSAYPNSLSNDMSSSYSLSYSTSATVGLSRV